MERRGARCLLHLEIQYPILKHTRKAINFVISIQIKPMPFAPSTDFEFKALAEANFYRKAIVQEFLPYLKGRVIDMGAGVGQMTTLFADIVGRIAH